MLTRDAGNASHRGCAAVCLGLCLWLSGCVTLPPPDMNVYGPYPHNYEAIVEQSVASWPAPAPDTTRSVPSVTEPTRQTRGEICGWGVWAKVRLTRPNRQGGVDIQERDHFFLLRDGKVLLSDDALRE
jgi:hypothetical protein